MGGSSKKQTVGYKYYLGMHMILCHGPVDFLRKITVDGKTLINGAYQDGQLSVNRPDLFGGEKREGGVSGTLDFETGLPTQGRNSYLQARLGSNIPAFRGVCGVVLRQMYLGVNPYLKRWAFRLQRIHTRQDGVEQWYDATSEITGGLSSTNVFYEQFNSGLSGYSVVVLPNQTEGGSLSDFDIVSDTYGNAIQIGTGSADSHPSIAKPLFGEAPLQAFSAKFKLTSLGADDCGVVALRDKDLNSIVNFNVARDSTVDSLRRPTVGFVDQNGNPGNPIGSGQVTIGEWYQVEATYNAKTSKFDCVITHIDSGVVFGSVSVTIGGRSNIAYVTFENDNFSGAGTCRFDDVRVVQTTGDMNPIHIIRECLTDPDWGMGYQESDIDDVSFMAAADTLFDEGMGISLLWDRQNTIEAFVQEITKHIDAALYVDRTTGKFVIKLIRSDYDENSLLEFDESNIGPAGIQNLSRANFGELVNSVTVNFWESSTGETGSLTVQDTALAQMQGSVINTTVQYPGFTNSTIAAKVAARDLKALSSPLWSCTVYADKDAEQLNIGDVFKLSWSDYGLNSVIMRVTGMAFGNGKTNKVKIICTQDVFALPDTVVVSAPDPEDGWQPIDNSAGPVVQRIATEAPYYEIVTLLGQVQTDDDLAANPDLGYVFAAGGRPSAEGSINALVYVDDGSGVYEDSDTMDFSPYAFIDEDVTAGQLTFAITGGVDLDIVEIGTHAQIGNELVRVDSISDTSITVGRGLLDTVPPPLHSNGSAIVFWDNYPASDEIQYSASEVINIKLLTTTGEGTLDEASAPIDSVTLNSRAIRPYPPGNVQVNSLTFPESIIGSSDFSLSWSHRDRTQQTSGDFYDYSDASIGPEVGTTYSIDLYNENGVLVKQLTGETGTSYLWDTETDDSGVVSGDPNGDPYYNDVVLSLHCNGADGSTSFPDSSQYARSVSAVGNAQVDTAQSKFGGASVLFDGNGDSLQLAGSTDFQPSGDFAFESWFRVNTYQTSFTFIAGNRRLSSGTIENSWSLGLSQSGSNFLLTLVIWTDNGASTLQAYCTTNATTGAWHHAAFSRDGDTIRIFMNGVHEATIDMTGESYDPSYDSFPLIIADGNNGGGASRCLNGWLDDIRITKGAPRYTANFTPPVVENPDAGTYRKNGKITYEIWSARDGYDSLYKQTHTVLRYGYGFNYGLYYGGV